MLMRIAPISAAVLLASSSAAWAQFAPLTQSPAPPSKSDSTQSTMTATQVDPRAKS